jgi:O-succinylhomoserine sulfhydrylase
MERQCATAMALALWLEAHPKVSRVFYPGLPSHPQYALAKRQQSAAGALVSFELKTEPGKEQASAWQVIDACTLISITGNLGDTRSTITHPATTTHGRLTDEQRRDAGIGDGLIRLSVGLEHLNDLKGDLSRGLDRA